jgi:hypothetical protein
MIRGLALLLAIVTTAANAAAADLTASPAAVELSVPEALGSVEAEVRVRNRGPAVTITRELVTVTDAFRIVQRPSYPLRVPSGGEFVLRVRFKARSEGRISGRLALYANAPAPALIVPLTGSAGPPGLGVFPAERLEFPEVEVGQTSAGIGRLLRNAGLSALDIGRISIEGAAASDFRVAPADARGVPVRLRPDASAAFEVVFAPSAAGAREAVLVIQSNDPTAPSVRIAVSGTGAPASLPAAPR